MWVKLLVQLCSVALCSREVFAFIYDFYSGEVVPPSYVLKFAHSNQFRECTIDVSDCSSDEGRRVDGSCNNVEHPTRGMSRGPYGRLLPPHYGPNNTVAAFSPDGTKWPLIRRVRTEIMPSARVVSTRFSMLTLHYTGFMTLDTTSINGVSNYLVEKTDCCTAGGMDDPKCMPILVPKDDPYLKDAGVSCMNLTRALTFQELGCIGNDHPSMAVNGETPLLDLSTVYGLNRTLANSVRQYSGGLLKMEYRKHRYVPPGKSSICYANKPNQPCYEQGDNTLNIQPKLMVFGIYYARLHNAIASQLAIINPCWNDEQLFQEARKINIALFQKITFYDLFTQLLGKDNMLKRGLITEKEEYVNVYNPKETPMVLAEFEVAFRALHSLLDDAFGLYDKKAKLKSTTSLNQWLFAVGVLEEKKNMEEMGRSLMYQASADSMVHSDPGMSNNMFTKVHKRNDLFSIDLMRGRDMGVRPYNEYRKLCGLPKAHKFEDFTDTISHKNIMKLRKLYKHVDAVELGAGVRVEKEVPGTAVGPTLLCIITEQLRIFKETDRFWFENGEVKTRLTPEQLSEVRKYSAARYVCDTVDGLELSQPQPFLVPSDSNPLRHCDHYRKLHLDPWKDSSCKLTSRGR